MGLKKSAGGAGSPFSISSALGKRNYAILKGDCRAGCDRCPFAFCVGSDCRPYKKLIMKDDDSVSYLLDPRFSYFEGEAPEPERRREVGWVLPLSLFMAGACLGFLAHWVVSSFL